MFKIISTNDNTYSIYGFPDRCPVCHEIDDPKVIHSHISNPSKPINGTVTAICTCSNCNADYAISFGLSRKEHKSCLTAINPKTLPYSAPPFPFSEQISQICPTFVEVYNQSIIAKNIGLNNLVGMGLRKALEFLIKDYLIYIIPTKSDDIKAKFLSACIEEYVTNDKIKIVAKRAVWLGNDQSHYVQKFSEHDIDDLLRLINLTAYWISAELETNEWDLLQPQQ